MYTHTSLQIIFLTDPQAHTQWMPNQDPKHEE